MPDIKDQRPTEYDARSIQHIYVNVPVDRPIDDADIRFIWKNHTADAEGAYTGLREGGVDYSLPYGPNKSRMIAPGHGLPPLPLEAFAAYARQLGYDTLPEFENKTGAFAHLAPAPEPKPEQQKGE